jgi:hypothetical protein
MDGWMDGPILVARIGRNKLIINHLGKLFVTSDAATIIKEIEVVHPAAKLLVMASEAQEAEVSFLGHCRSINDDQNPSYIPQSTDNLLLLQPPHSDGRRNQPRLDSRR